MKKILIPTKLNKVAAETLTATGEYEVVQDESTPLIELAAAHADSYALIVRSEKVGQEIIDAMPGLSIIVRAGSGYNTIDTKYARKRGINVMNTPGANANAVAEEVIAMMLADARHVIHADPSTRSGKWEKKKFMGREIAGKTIGIIGLGNIGRTLAKRLSGFDNTLLGYDPVISSERAAEAGVELAPLARIFSESDYITLHIPENNETRGMVNYELLSQMKEGATLINCARAGIIVEDDLRKAKPERGIRFLNDVYPKDAEGDKSVADIADLMLPHLGASTVEANINAARRAAEELIDLDSKGITSFIVNRDIPEGLDESYCELANMLARLCRSLLGRDAALHQIETSFYGELQAFADWLIVPITAAIWDDFEQSMDSQAARKFLEDMGIEYNDRNVDPKKGFVNSMTIDLIGNAGADTLRRMSVRGTVAEGMLMVSRINEFDKLWFEPIGNTVMFLYDDRPGVLGKIGMTLASNGVNIEDVRNPHDFKTNHSLAIMKVNQLVPQKTIDEISAEIEALAAFSIKL